MLMYDQEVMNIEEQLNEARKKEVEWIDTVITKTISSIAELEELDFRSRLFQRKETILKKMRDESLN